MTNYKRYVLYKLLSFLSFALPVIVLVALNFGKFYVKSGSKITLYGYLAIIMLLVAFKNKAVSGFKKNPPLTLSIILLLTGILMKNFYYELISIAIAGIVGSILSSVFAPIERIYFAACFKGNDGNYYRSEEADLPQKEAWKRAYR